MVMNSEERKEYNKQYYINNKQKIIEKATTKIACSLCGRVVINNNINNHMKSKLCLNTQNKNKFINDRLESSP